MPLVLDTGGEWTELRGDHLGSYCAFEDECQKMNCAEILFLHRSQGESATRTDKEVAAVSTSATLRYI